MDNTQGESLCKGQTTRFLCHGSPERAQSLSKKSWGSRSPHVGFLPHIITCNDNLPHYLQTLSVTREATR